MTDETPTDRAGDMIIFGCGAMAQAMLSRWLEKGLSPNRVTAVRASGAPVSGGVTTVSDASALAPPSILVIGLKPQAFAALVPALLPLVGAHTRVVSIMAGITLDDLSDALPGAAAIMRVMPNMAVATGRGVVVTAMRGGDAADPAFDALLATLGHVHAMPDETGFNLVTALTGCGPAFVYRFVQALAGAAVRLGLDAGDADRLARATVAGAAASMAQSQLSPGELADAVASPGGMTQAGLDVLDSDGRLTGLMAETLRAARDRGRELASPTR
jgi:pyrroline-5-carboxylate reductase